MLLVLVGGRPRQTDRKLLMQDTEGTPSGRIKVVTSCCPSRVDNACFVARTLLGEIQEYG